jgi:hypothetical protein
MKKNGILFSLFLIMTGLSATAQTVFKEYKVGHPIFISLPDYLNLTAGLNASATLQYKNEVKDVYGFVIEDNKEEMGYMDMKFGSVDEYYEDFMKGFTKEMEKMNLSKPLVSKKGENTFIETDLSYYDAEAKLEIYYLVGIVETKTAYYKVLSWSSAENKDKFKADFQKILYSFKD